MAGIRAYLMAQTEKCCIKNHGWHGKTRMAPHQNLWVDLVEKLRKPPSTQGLWLGEGLHFLGVTKPSTGSSSLLGTFRYPGQLEGCKWLQQRQPMPGVDFQAVRSLVSMAQVLERIGFVPVECSGGQVRGPCPVGSQMVTAVCAGPQDWNGDQRRGTRTLPRPGKRRFTHGFW